MAEPVRKLTFAKDTLGRFLLKHQIGLDWEMVPRNPFWSAEQNAYANHYKVRLYKPDGKEMNLYFSKGTLLKGPPRPEEVMNTLGTDALYYESYEGNLLPWAEDIGLDPDSPETGFMIDEMNQSVKDLKAFLGRKVYGELISLGEKGFLGRKQLV